MSVSQPLSHPTFRLLRSRHIDSLKLDVEEYQHTVTGARHIHLAADDEQNVFLVAFRTVPQDSTGVAHILEHTSLCGSQHYPVRDPFFMMTRRSLNTFMNAFTSSDWTAYPFASQNRKDFDNLLGVYLDAVFFPTLHPLDFAQEGHRVEFSEADNPQSPLEFKGVVFNEMKGAMSSPVSALWQSLTSELFPTITYHHNSGGDPAHIPDLSYDELKAFHARHYHPSNALFMTFGKIAAVEHQARFESQALAQFGAEECDISVPDEQRFSAPQYIDDRYPLDGEEETRGKTHIVLGWLLDSCIDSEVVMRAHLLSGVLLDNSASPLRKALETSDLGSAPSPLCGLADSNREMVFAAGVEGSDPEQADAVEALVLEVLSEVANNGVEQSVVESVLHQLELSQREVNGDGYPYGLQLIVHALSPTLHGADPVEVLDIDPVLAQLREQIKEPAFIMGLARQLLDNPHRVRLVMRPDTGLSEERANAEAARLAEIQQRLSADEAAAIVSQAAALAARQAEQDDPELLPKVGLEDVPLEMSIPKGESAPVNDLPATWYSRATNGIIYQQVIIDLPELEPEFTDLLPLLGDLITEVGSGGRDYLATQAHQAAISGGLSGYVSLRGSVDDTARARALLVLSGKALTSNHAAHSELMLETLFTARFDEQPRIHELITQDRMHREQGVTSHGHSLAMTAASAALSPSAALAQRWNGLEGIRQIKQLDQQLTNSEEMAGFCERLEQLRDRLLSAPRQLLTIAEEDAQQSITAELARQWQRYPQGDAQSLFTPAPVSGRVMQGWATSTQVNFCARAYPTVAPNHEDAPALMILAGFLRNNYLHRVVREQGGAYGGGASFDPDNGAFRFYSYRDPRLAETLADFDASIDWLLNNNHEWRLVEEAILGVIGSIDKPGSPAGEAKRAFHAELNGRTPEQRRRFRDRILQVRESDMKRAAERYLDPARAHTAVVSNAKSLARAADLGLELIQL